MKTINDGVVFQAKIERRIECKMNLGHSQLNLCSARKSTALMEIEIYAKWKIDLKFNVFFYFASVHFSHILFNNNNNKTHQHQRHRCYRL